MARITLPRQVGLVVASARKARGLTQSQLAQIAGVSRQLVNRLETGTASGIALDKLLPILGAAGCALDVSPLEENGCGTERHLLPAAPATQPTPAAWDECPSEYSLDATLFERAKESR